MRERVAQRRTDEEQRGDFAALEARTERDGGEEELRGPVVNGELLAEAGDDGGDAKADESCGATGEDGHGDEQPAGGRAQRRIADAAAKEMGDGMRRACEGHADKTEDDSRSHGSEDALDGDCWDRRNRVDSVVDAPGFGREVAKEGGEQARCKSFVVHGANGEDFEPEDGA